MKQTVCEHKNRLFDEKNGTLIYIIMRVSLFGCLCVCQSIWYKRKAAKGRIFVSFNKMLCKNSEKENKLTFAQVILNEHSMINSITQSDNLSDNIAFLYCHNMH